MYVCMYVALPSQSRYPTIVYSVANQDPILATFGQICKFRDPKLGTLFLWIDPFFRIKNTSLFIYSSNILVRLLAVNMKNCRTSKNPKMCEPHSSNSIENATPL